MRKKVLQIALDMAVAILATIVIAIFSKVSFETMVNNMTWMLIVLITYIIIDDPINMALNSPKMITKPYMIGLGFFSTSLVFFEVAYFVNSQFQELLFLGLSVLVLSFGIFWTYQNYIDPSYKALEIERLKLNKIRNSISGFGNKKPITREQCEILLQGTMRFRLEGDDIKGDVDLTRPFDSENYCTVNQMMKRDCSPTITMNAKIYINKLLDKIYLEKK